MNLTEGAQRHEAAKMPRLPASSLSFIITRPSPAPSPLNPCLPLTVHISVRAFHTRDVFARLSAHSRYRAPSRRRWWNLRRLLKGGGGFCLGGRLAATHISISPAQKPTPKSLRSAENCMRLVLQRAWHGHHREEQRRTKQDTGHQKRPKRVFSALTGMNAVSS